MVGGQMRMRRGRWMGGIGIGIGILSGVTTVRGAAAAPAPIKVDSVGRLVIPASIVRPLRPRVGPDGILCVEFPPIPGFKPGYVKDPERATHNPATPPRAWVTLRADGSVAIARRRMHAYKTYIPGPPGTPYVVSARDGRLVLKIPGSSVLKYAAPVAKKPKA